VHNRVETVLVVK